MTYEIVPLHSVESGSAGRGHSGKVRFDRTNTEVIMAKEFEPIKWIVSGYISEGFTVLAGRQKLGKTWLAMDIAIAVATGGAALGSTAMPG